ncbi:MULTISPECIES: hypothetical protein [unclassified Bradyrhizobium]|uniref:hypothetical protein n=1 Tax=unclassified Bradyrhizobium TaxID=2631580 RepID=UPI001BA9B71E|nr:MULTISPECIES: hypothetical protein [unclassified Bradyrhizobium]MBR1203453.1 hypothetical protein [Bradyrhizobium sp. AUGA SZCCT0124]MBR1313116.1 hypothetical protein [Bradyrhizobium sp. AUGA SZCCT0051]MBR1341474.1 hypothetical protein [Bradyrhizobium sp. AUGA SZCCT0105]MBR1356588.1 hypothetical protein [Bradyrhizobium sp. AUGA SZCCT0045]
MSVAQGSAGFNVARLGYVTVAIFIGTFITGTAAMLGLSVSACFLSHVIRCFSFSRDFAGFFINMIQLWSFPALIVGLLVAVIAEIRGLVTWWNILPVVVLVCTAEFVLSKFSDAALLFLAHGLVLFVGVQLSRVTSRLVGKYRI